MIEFFFKKRPTGYNPNYFWFLTVQDWSTASPARAVFPLRTPVFQFNLVLDNQRKKLTKNGKVLNTEQSQRKLK